MYIANDGVTLKKILWLVMMRMMINYLFFTFQARSTCYNFFHKYLWRNPQQTLTFFCTIYMVQFFAIVCYDSQEGENQAYQDPFLRLNSIPPYGTWIQLYLTLSILLPTITHVTAILSRHVNHSPKKYAEKKSQQSMWTQPHLFQCNLLLLQNRPQILVKKIATHSPTLKLISLHL